MGERKGQAGFAQGRGDQLVGAQLLTNLTQDKNGHWQGKLFIPDKNMRVTAKIQPVGEQQLKVSGCAVGKTLCKARDMDPHRWDVAKLGQPGGAFI